MAEKVIFEYRPGDRSENSREDCWCAIQHGFGATKAFSPFMWAFCQAVGDHERRKPGRSKRSHRIRDESQRGVRETLDFLERLYDDLYGKEGSSERKDR